MMASSSRTASTLNPEHMINLTTRIVRFTEYRETLNCMEFWFDYRENKRCEIPTRSRASLKLPFDDVASHISEYLDEQMLPTTINSCQPTPTLSAGTSYHDLHAINHLKHNQQ